MANPAAYRPTSLDFINRPNPVEPQSVQQRHPLNVAPRLEQTAKEDFSRLLRDDPASSSTAERPAKRRKSGDAGSKLLDLPRLPTVKNGAKRMRIPPTLSGLHQPPPNAGLLPSISTEQPVRNNGRAIPQTSDGVATEISTTRAPEAGLQPKRSPKVTAKATSLTRSKRNKWEEEETTCLLKGVARFGMGNWTRILKCPDYQFKNRTAIDLKDRFRVCCPEEYRKSTSLKPAKIPEDAQSTTVPPQEPSRVAASTRLERKSSVELRKIGIEEPFEKSKRRPRTGYTKEEDAALLKGFEIYGNSWASIQQDESLGLGSRQSTDLRDRFRTKYPERYRKAGLTPRPEVFPKKPDRRRNTPTRSFVDIGPSSSSRNNDSSQTSDDVQYQRKEKENKDPTSTQPPKPVPVTSLLQYDDVFWSAPLDVSDTDFDRPTLDRRILDWPLDVTRPAAVPTNASVDPLATVKPHAPRPTLPEPGATQGLSQSTGTLPSLAAVTSIAGPDGEFMAQLELPTLVGVLGEIGYEGKGPWQIPSLEELLS